MRIDPAIAALRADPALLPAACARVAAGWDAASGRAGPVLADLARHGDGAGLDTCPALRRALSGGRFAGRMLAGALSGLRDAPLGQLRRPHFASATLHSLTLAMAGRSSLSLALVDGDAWGAAGQGAARRAGFQGGELALTVLAGEAEGRIVRRGGEGLTFRSVALRRGARLDLDAEREALVLDRVGAMLATLRLYRRPARPTAMEEVDLATGAVVHRAAARQRDSRMELAMALLGRMGRIEAAPAIADVAADRALDPALRWQALREGLALDSAQGFAALLGAGEAGDPLSGPARQLAEQLAARHPALAAMREDALCPA